MIVSMSAHPWLPIMAFGTKDGRVIIWDVETRAELRSWFATTDAVEVEHPAYDHTIVAIDPTTGTRVATCTRKNVIHIWDLTTGDHLCECYPPAEDGKKWGEWVHKLVWSLEASGACFLAALQHGVSCVWVWNATTGYCTRLLVQGSSSREITSLACCLANPSDSDWAPKETTSVLVATTWLSHVVIVWKFTQSLPVAMISEQTSDFAMSLNGKLNEVVATRDSILVVDHERENVVEWKPWVAGGVRVEPGWNRKNPWEDSRRSVRVSPCSPQVLLDDFKQDRISACGRLSNSAAQYVFRTGKYGWFESLPRVFLRYQFFHTGRRSRKARKSEWDESFWSARTKAEFRDIAVQWNAWDFDSRGRLVLFGLVLNNPNHVTFLHHVVYVFECVN